MEYIATIQTCVKDVVPHKIEPIAIAVCLHDPVKLVCGLCYEEAFKKASKIAPPSE